MRIVNSHYIINNAPPIGRTTNFTNLPKLYRDPLT
jgi:hypothetical protein